MSYHIVSPWSIFTGQTTAVWLKSANSYPFGSSCTSLPEGDHSWSHWHPVLICCRPLPLRQWPCRSICACILITYNTLMHCSICMCLSSYANMNTDMPLSMWHIHSSYDVWAFLYVYLWADICMYLNLLVAHTRPGTATARQCVCDDVGSIPTGGSLEVWPWTFGFRTAWLVKKPAELPHFIKQVTYA